MAILNLQDFSFTCNYLRFLLDEVETDTHSNLCERWSIYGCIIMYTYSTQLVASLTKNIQMTTIIISSAACERESERDVESACVCMGERERVREQCI